eukprot:10886452-Prorocentrum_lima.AAC.1
MTSSLVGSEMCIRDRSLTLGTWAGGREGGLRGNGMVWAEVQWHGDVSYTHLTLPTICSV